MPMVKRRELRINIEYLLAYVVLRFFAVLPLSIAIVMSRTMARLGYWMPKLRRTGKRNLELAFPELSRHERRRLLRGCFENLGRLLAVFSQFSKGNPEKLSSLIE